MNIADGLREAILVVVGLWVTGVAANLTSLYVTLRVPTTTLLITNVGIPIVTGLAALIAMIAFEWLVWGLDDIEGDNDE